MAASGQPALGERWCEASRRTARKAPPGEAPGVRAAAAMMSSADRREAGQVHEIVEARRSPAEGLVPRRAVADHAVGGVDRLVERRAGQAAEPSQKAGATIAVGEILGQALDGGAGDARLVQALRDCGRRSSTRRRARRRSRRSSQPLRHGRDMLVQAALGDQAAGEDRQER